MQKGIKQKDLATRLQMRQATISDIENGRIKNPHIDTMTRIAKELGVPVDGLLQPSA